MPGFLPVGFNHRKDSRPNQGFGYGLIDSGSGSSISGWIQIGISGSKIEEKKLQPKKIDIFSYRKLQFTFPYASIKDVKATGEAVSPQKRTYSTSKHETFLTFSCFVGHFAFLDPDPLTWLKNSPSEEKSNFFKDQRMYFDLREGLLYCRRGLQSTRENIRRFKTWNLFHIFLFLGSFFIQKPDRIPIRNTT